MFHLTKFTSIKSRQPFVPKKTAHTPTHKALEQIPLSQEGGRPQRMYSHVYVKLDDK